MADQWMQLENLALRFLDSVNYVKGNIMVLVNVVNNVTEDL